MHLDPFQGEIPRALGGRGAGVMTTGAGDLQIAVVDHPQAQPRRRRVTPLQVERLKPRVGNGRGRRGQRLATTRTDRGPMHLGGVGREPLRPPDSGRPGLLARPALRRRLRPVGRRFGSVPRGLVGLRPRYLRLGLRLLRPRVRARRTALPRRPTTRRAGAIARILRQPLPGFLQIGQQGQRQRTQSLLRQSPHSVLVELLKIVLTEFHVACRREKISE
jgi:hypothetical protein